MMSDQRKKLHGIIPAIVTPIKETGELDADLLKTGGLSDPRRSKRAVSLRRNGRRRISEDRGKAGNMQADKIDCRK